MNLFNGPKHAYAYPSSLSSYRFQFRIELLEEQSGSAPRSDHIHSVAQQFSLGYTQEEEDNLLCYSGVVHTPYVHPAKLLNLTNHKHGVGFYIRCTNLAESLSSVLFFRSEYNSEQFKTVLNEGLSKDNSSLTLFGSCPLFHTLVPIKVHLDIEKQKYNCYIKGAKVWIEKENMEKFINLAKDTAP